MILADVVEQKKEALRVEDVARILDISVKQIESAQRSTGFLIWL